MGCSSSTPVRTEPIKIMVLGVDNAGKSTFVAAVKGEDVDLVAPTVGFSPEEFKLGQRTVKVYDLGGGGGFRGIWNNYYAEVHGIVYVVDTTDPARFGVIRDNLARELAHPRLGNKPVLLLGNKSDLPGSLSKDELRKVLEIDLVQLTVHVQTCCAKRRPGKRLDAGIRSGLKWLVGEIDARLDQLQPKIASDVAEYNAEVKRDRDERRRQRELLRQKEEEEQAAKDAAVASAGAVLPSSAPVTSDGTVVGTANRLLASPRDISANVPSLTIAAVPVPTAAQAGGVDAPASGPGSRMPSSSTSSVPSVSSSASSSAATTNNGAVVGAPAVVSSGPASASSRLVSPRDPKGVSPRSAQDTSPRNAGDLSATGLGVKPSLPRIASLAAPNLDSIISDAPFLPASSKLSPKLEPIDLGAAPTSNNLNMPLDTR